MRESHKRQDIGGRMNASELIAKGYRRISIRHKMISRIDREDWREHLAKKLYCPITEGDTRSCWEDYYRRGVSKDVIVVSDEIIALIPTSGYDYVGYIKDYDMAVAEAQRLAEWLQTTLQCR